MKCQLCEREFNADEVAAGVPVIAQSRYKRNRNISLVRFSDGVIHQFELRQRDPVDRRRYIAAYITPAHPRASPLIELPATPPESAAEMPGPIPPVTTPTAETQTAEPETETIKAMAERLRAKLAGKN